MRSMPRISNIGKVCSVEECSINAWATGLCRTHYSRLRRTGTLIKNIHYSHREAREYFEKSILVETNECIEWKYYRSPSGHGQITVNNRRKPVHAYALLRKTGFRPKDKPNALHKPIICHNPSCFNYRHLYWGDQKENMRDMMIDRDFIKKTLEKTKDD